ncbi:MAG: PA14 domain-containing protein [Desulfobacterales bacterium]|jgi:hypothetical protein
MIPQRTRKTGIWLLTVMVVIGGCASADRAALPTVDLDPEAVKPGLTVYYTSGFFRHADMMPSFESVKDAGWSGTPVARLNHHFGSGEVFDSGKNRGIGVYLDGVVHLQEPGTYRFAALSNDGIRVWIGSEMVVDDPYWHAQGDRRTPEGAFHAPAARWYPIRIQYFQRKGTAALEVYWRRPGDVAPSIIPADVLGHLPGS